MITITGHSDDLIEVDGDIREEFPYTDTSGGDLIGLSDGTLLRIRHDADGVWRITPAATGTAFVGIAQAAAWDGGTDTATLGGGITWVLHGTTVAGAPR